MSEMIQAHCSEGVLTLVLNRPEKRNALSAGMYQRLAKAFRDAAEDPAVRAVLLLGQPGAYCAGNELESFLDVEHPGPDMPVFEFMRALAACPLPVVTAVDGMAVGIGATLLLHCDLVYATPRARLQFPFARLGVCPEFGASLLLQRVAGRAHAAEALLIGEPVSAERAHQWGLISEVVPESAIGDHVRNRAHALALLPVDAVRTTKRLLRDAEAAQTEAAMAREQVEFLRLLSSAPVQQGLRDYIAARKARA